MEQNKPNIILIVAAIILILVLAAWAYGSQMLNKKEAVSTKPQETPAKANETTTTEPTPATTNAEYKDGTYTAVGDYTSPGGAEQVGVTITLKDGMISDAVVEVKATRPISKTKQEDFAANYKPQVVGKDIDEVMLTKVSGSSLTPKGFNDALNKIKAEAKS